MSNKIIHILSKRHKEWIKMAKSFKLSDDNANEIVQEMYLRLYDYTKDIEKIMYNKKEVNTFYIYITLRNLYYSGFTNYGKSPKNKKMILFSEIESEDFDGLINQISEDYEEINDDITKKINLDVLCDKIDDIIDDWYWYDKKLAKLYLNTDMSMRDISKETNISLSSIFNTLTNAKEKIRHKTKKEYKEYKKHKS
tara:strand:- start:307 stop:894 length:588 start_codon:yes stop_codon:yes gene_type:complete